MQTAVVPFFIAHVYQGFATAHGLARTTSDGLTREFEVKDALVGMLTTGVRVVHIHLDDLDGVELLAGWFTTRLRIRTTKLAAMSAVPGDHTGSIQLGVKRRDRVIARALASAIALRLSERQLERLGRGTDAVTETSSHRS
jgi:hypothetical protein